VSYQRSISAVAALLFAFSLPFAARVSAQRRAIDTQRSTITVRVFKSGLFSAFADNHIIEAHLADGSVDDSATPHVEIVVEAQRMRVLDPGLSPKDRENVQARMLGPEVLDANRFPQIRFRSTALQRLAPNQWLVHGELELHGQTRQVDVKVSHESVSYKGTATLRQRDFGITPISIAGGTVKVKDEVTIEFEIVAVES